MKNNSEFIHEIKTCSSVKFTKQTLKPNISDDKHVFDQFRQVKCEHLS